MAVLTVSPAAVLLLFVTLAATYVLVRRRLQTTTSATQAAKVERDEHSKIRHPPAEPSQLGGTLAAALPDSVTLPDARPAFKSAVNKYWAQQECEVTPSCVVRPRNAEELSKAVTIIKREYDGQASKREPTGNRSGTSSTLFAIRSGGHSPVAGAASVEGGVLIDLGGLNEVCPSEDGHSVSIGAGAKWMDVSKVLDQRDLAVVGGRNSAVGVGGLTLGGGLSFFTPRYGLVCSNIISYQVILASGTIVTADATNNPNLWRALKGGSNNFGIVTQLTARSFPTSKIWSGFLYLPSFQASKVLACFHESVDVPQSTGVTGTKPDIHAAGPIACFTYVHQLGIQAISVNIVYTAPPDKEGQWPEYWQRSPFSRLWRLWSTCVTRTLTSATDELNILNPPGKRQSFATTTIKNDQATLAAAHEAYASAILAFRKANVKNLVFTLVLQPFPSSVSQNDCPLPLGLNHDASGAALVNVSFTVNWPLAKDDETVKALTRLATEEIDDFASANGTGHRYRYLNYCAEWQRPFEGYGVENLAFLRDVSARYDPDGLFQKGCPGGFKLWETDN
ncbi:hypothetical protein LTR85_009875 [Meristemomyces frigidus]|nr:hypothetical protein LTR85_009875 [Meristemomyces frigidus]